MIGTAGVGKTAYFLCPNLGIRHGGNNMLHLVNQYMDAYLRDPENLAYKARAEKNAKIISKKIISSGGLDSGNYGQNAFFYDAVDSLLTATILLIAVFCSPEKRLIGTIRTGAGTGFFPLIGEGVSRF